MDLRVSAVGSLDAEELQFVLINCDNTSVLESSLPTISTFSNGRLLLLGFEGVFDEDVCFDWQGQNIINKAEVLVPNVLRQISLAEKRTSTDADKNDDCFSSTSSPSDATKMLPGIVHGTSATFSLKFTLLAPVAKLLLR